MQQEQYTPQVFDQSPQRAGATFEHNHQGYIEGSDTAQQEAERARADAHAALQSQEEPVKKSLEYAPLPQEMIRAMGLKVVFGLRKPHNEGSIYLFDEDSDVTAPYFESVENKQANPYMTKTWNTADQPQTPIREDLSSKEAA